MVGQYIKDLYYLTVGRLSVFSLLWYKLVYRLNPPRDLLVNIGCGVKYIEGMVNIDGNIFRKKEIWLDVTLGLPFPDNSIRGIYASHFLEHLNSRSAVKFLSECYRVLKPQGALRIIVPSLEYAIKAYNENKAEDLSEFPEKFNSIGGRFNNFMLCANQHFIMLDFSFAEELLQRGRFSRIFRARPQNSICFTKEDMQFEESPIQNSLFLYIEAYK